MKQRAGIVSRYHVFDLFTAGIRGGGQQYRDDASASSDTSEYFERDVVIKICKFSNLS
jgi:hypothetical protein